MPELTYGAALRHATSRRYGDVSEDTIMELRKSSRRARLLLNSGDPDAWQKSGAIRSSLAPSPGKAALNFARAEIKRLISRQVAVDPRQASQRLAACRECPHSRTAPDDRLYHFGKRIIRPDGDDICGLCGCFVSEKVKRRFERCPSPLSEASELSRWHEPL